MTISAVKEVRAVGWIVGRVKMGAREWLGKDVRLRQKMWRVGLGSEKHKLLKISSAFRASKVRNLAVRDPVEG